MDVEILTLSAITTAYVGVAKGFKVIPNRYLPLVALGVAAVFVLVPDAAQTKLAVISTVGLGAVGLYTMAKNKGGS
jgi:hypothetical protein